MNINNKCLFNRSIITQGPTFTLREHDHSQVVIQQILISTWTWHLPPGSGSGYTNMGCCWLREHGRRHVTPCFAVIQSWEAGMRKGTNADKQLSKKKIQKNLPHVWLGKTLQLSKTHEIKRSCNGWDTFSYTNGGEASSSNIFGADESSRCQNVCNMKSCLYDCTPSDLTIGFSHALQTNSNTRLLPDIISQAMKCFRRVFSNNDSFHCQASPSPIMSSDE